MSKDFLNAVPGVIHVGANVGQERDLYAQLGLRVVWVEPIPSVYQRLVESIQHFPEQRAFQHLVTDRDGQSYPFFLSNNDGRSSSILDIHLHKDIWPHVYYEGAISLTSITLDTLLSREAIDVEEYPALVMDTQGSELLVLKGASQHLARFKYIKTEAADFEAYSKCCQLDDITAYLKDFGFRETRREPFATRPGGGSYFDVTYSNVSSGAA